MRRPSVAMLLALIAAWTSSSFAQKPQDVSEVWSSLKKRLQAKNGDEFFKSTLKDSAEPDGTKGVRAFKGTVVSSRPSEHPGEVVVAISDTTTPEAILKFVDRQGNERPFKSPISPGSKIAFSGVVRAYMKDPFMLTFDVQDEGPTFAVAVAVEARGQAITMPKVSVNYPYSLTPRFVNISLDGLPLHRVTINDQGATTETMGVLLERFLETAGWFRQAGFGTLMAIF